MNLRSIANQAAQSINPNIPVSVSRSIGYTIGAGRKQIPTYAAAVPGFGQLQALDGVELKQLEGLNIQGEIKAINLYGKVSGALRPDGIGGDLIEIDGKIWLVVKVLEGWATWSRAAIVLQGS